MQIMEYIYKNTSCTQKVCVCVCRTMFKDTISAFEKTVLLKQKRGKQMTTVGHGEAYEVLL